ncbi:alpha-alpha-trehalase precursor [Encephalitozoon intestinalis ATCC 50506]|uniref:Trehalase n=1 Tax=Encephalitozoon intestinalis (strain ATCC 50506) TaxID=876142 RepID=E0S5Z5_ENCIT|nr:alpha-alpha-trehalase precursor [Encephalitozoon intestinalis ATCC 50506]ADM11130.1 alpha-alpha-trehalase precursor [Encephalitozoon intestinalis ATCC 50506]UTX44784.1 alpha-alpha-trehalase precursor [Encephalitozoon intestinalis]
MEMASGVKLRYIFLAACTIIPVRASGIMDPGSRMSSELLEVSFVSKITKDSKILVDKVFTKPPEEIDEILRNMLRENRSFEKEEDFWRFVDENSFEPETELIFGKDDKELQADMPKNTSSYIIKLEEKLSDGSNPLFQTSQYKQSIANLIRIGKELENAWGKIYVRQNRLKRGQYSTMIKVKNPFIIPGDRFKEAYYWDSSWILEGLVRSGMEKIAVGMVENFIGLIEQFGFIPNGLRTYYLNRSQPPYFPQMLLTLYKHLPWEKIENTIKRGLDAAVTEHTFFMTQKVERVEKNGKSYVLNVYKVNDTTPRAESYSEDRETAEQNKSRDEKYRRRAEDIYADLKAGAESGWDFSSRWLGLSGQLDSIRVSKRIPADLNSVMYANECIISKLYEIIEGKNSKNSKYFKEKSEERKDAINNVLWNDQQGVWNDFDIETREHTSPGFYASNLMPMCYGIPPPKDKGVSVYHILNMFAEDIFGHPGGMPASGSKNKDSTLQWDFPNMWPPLVHIVAFFLERVGEREMALHMVRSYLENISVSTSVVDETKRGIFEKYSCEMVGSPGYKGEYTAQVGFGWTNGIAIHFLDRFSSEIVSPKSHEESYKEIKALLEKRILDKAEPKNHTPEGCLLLEERFQVLA